MALSADKVRKIAGRSRLAFQLADGVTTYAGSYAALRGTDHATAASRGYGANFTAAAGVIPLGGFHDTGKTGDTSASPVPEVFGNVDGAVLLAVAVTGASAITDQGKWVYLSDDDTLTLTRPTVGMPIGIITRWITSTTCNVYLFSFAELLAIAAGGGAQGLICLGSWDLSNVNPNAPGGATVDIATGIPMVSHGKILSWFAMVDIAVTGGATGDSYDLTLEIDGTDVTGGTLNVAQGDAAGAKIVPASGSEISGNNEFHEGDLLDIQVIENNSGANLTAGRVNLFLEVEYQPGM